MSFEDGLLVGTTGKSGGNDGVGGNVGKGDKSSCSKQKASDDKLSKSTQTLVESINKNPSSASKHCYEKAQDISKRRETFDRYREALPSARAANAVNKLGDDDEPIQSDCLTMITDAETLNAELGLEPDTIFDDELRDDETGFRAVMFKDEATGKYILVARDTQPTSLVDWATNIWNGKGEDTAQYEAMRDLATTLKDEHVSFDIAGYSKGGGLAQEAGLISTDSQVYVFNSAGISDASLGRTGNVSFDNLESRTSSFSSEGEFLTHMNNTTNPEAQIANADFLRNQLSGEGPKILGLLSPMKISYRNPELKEAYEKYNSFWSNPFHLFNDKNPDPTFERDKERLLNDMDQMTDTYRQDLADGKSFRIFPPVHSGHHETVENSRSMMASLLGSGDFDSDSLNTTKLIQHQMSAVLDPMEESVKNNRVELAEFNSNCG